ncbi:hypothetical protein D3C81_1193330 [compost metagenome]
MTPPGSMNTRSIWYCTSSPASLQVGMSPQLCVAVTLPVYCMRDGANTHSARCSPARHWPIDSDGLFTLESMCLPESCVAASPPPLYGM